MNSSAFRHTSVVIAAAAIVTTISTTPATAKPGEGGTDRPCFMVRSHWNDAEGEQPRCPNGPFILGAPEVVGGAEPIRSGRILDFMP